MNPYEILGMRNYTQDKDIDYKRVNSELGRLYESKRKFLERKIEILMEKYKFSEVDGQIKEIENYIQKIEELYGTIDENEEVELINKRIADINKAIESIRRSKEEIGILEKAYSMVRTPDLRLIYSLEQIKREVEGNSEGLIHKLGYKRLEESQKSEVSTENITISLSNSGTLGYVNWTKAYQAYINQYQVSISSGDKIVDVTLYTELSRSDLQNEKFQEFLFNTILSPRYISYAVKKNRGYLGTPKIKSDGNFEIDFNTEDLAAVMEYEKLLKEQKQLRTKAVTDSGNEIEI